MQHPPIPHGPLPLLVHEITLENLVQHLAWIWSKDGANSVPGDQAKSLGFHVDQLEILCALSTNVEAAAGSMLDQSF